MAAKSTLFEAEGIISVNIEELDVKLRKIAENARAQIEKQFGDINLTKTLGGGDQRASDLRALDKDTRDELQRAKLLSQRASQAGDLTDAVKHLSDAEKRLQLTENEQIAVGNKILSIGIKQEQSLLKLARAETVAADKALNLARLQARGDQQAGLYKEGIERLNLAIAKYNSSASVEAIQKTENMAAGLRNAAIATAGMSPQMRRMNAAITNASYGMQDFIVVMQGGGGLTRALASASNNIAFMTSVLAPGGLGAALGLAATLMAGFIGGLFESRDATEEAKDKLAEYRTELERILKLRQEIRGIEETAAKGDVQGLKNNLNDLKGQEADIRKSIKDAEEELKLRTERTQRALNEERQRKRREGIGAVETPREKELIQQQQEFFAEYQNKVREATAKIGALLPEIRAIEEQLSVAEEAAKNIKAAEELRKILEEERDGFNNFFDAIEKFSEKIKAFADKVKEDIKTPEEKLQDFFNQLIQAVNAGELTMKQAETAYNAAAKELANKKSLPGLKENQKTLSSAFDQLFPTESQKQKIQEQFDKLETLFPSQKDALGKFEDAMIANLNKNPGISGTVAPQQFASQLTNQLLQREDPLKKLAKENPELLNAIKTKLGDVESAIKDAEGGSPFE